MAPTRKDKAFFASELKKQARAAGRLLAIEESRSEKQGPKINKKHHFATEKEKKRVFEAYDSGGDYMTVAKHNNISQRQVYYLLEQRRNLTQKQPWGGKRDKLCKVTPEMVDCCLDQLEETPSVTLHQLQTLLFQRFQVNVCSSTIRRHLQFECYTLKQLRHQKMAMNNEDNIKKRKKFVLQLEAYQREGAMIIF